jgi:hypothetical protein
MLLSGILAYNYACRKTTFKQSERADLSLPISIATWMFLDSEAFGLDWQYLLARQKHPFDRKGSKSLPLALDLKLLTLP